MAQAFDNAVVEPFLRYIVQQPSLRQAVLHDAQVAQQAAASRTRADWMAGRDAAARLRTYASDLGFSDAAHVFYTSYEFFCLRLLSL